jgi:TFIIF-interacting CTD phosphatase-like protein
MQTRPLLYQFLEEMSALFNIIVYTFGTRNYALGVLNTIDKEQKYLNREKLISRNESIKNVKELDKVISKQCKSMTVIIDDTAEVWKEYPLNLIHVKKFLYFKDGEHGGQRTQSETDSSGPYYDILQTNPDLYLYFLSIRLKVLHAAFFFFEGKYSIPVYSLIHLI